MAPRARQAFAGARGRPGRRRTWFGWSTGSSARLSSGWTPTRSPTRSTSSCATGLSGRLIAGEMEVEDLPAAWNAGHVRVAGGFTRAMMARAACRIFTGIAALWGYFPTYTLGAMTAAQLFAAAKAPTPGPARRDCGRRLLAPSWLSWGLRSMAAGHRFPAKRSCTRPAVVPLDAEVFKAHLRARYLPKNP